MKKLSFFAFLLMPFYAFGAIENCATLTSTPTETLNLPQIIELGLCRNPQTAASYLAYESSRYSKNAGYANYLPSVNASTSFSSNYRNSEWDHPSWGGASLSASYLIFDFGKRLSDQKQLIYAWQAAGFDYDENVQNYIYSLIGSYYSLLNADADVKSAEKLLSVAKTARDMATKKFNAGSVAKADVLKADTTLASRELDLERTKNNREIAKGKLLTQLSFSADDELSIADLPAEIGTPGDTKSLDELFELAQKQRPDLLRASANKDSAWHRRNSAFLKNLPSISASGRISWHDDSNQTQGNFGASIGISASMPIFAGFANMYGIKSAQANYERAIESERNTNDSASLDVFTAYQNYKTAQKVLNQTETLLKSATESERVTSGMYKVGRATMLDWQTAQSELLDAQKQHNAARYDLFTKRAAVALSIGDIKAEIEKEENNGKESE